MSEALSRFVEQALGSPVRAQIKLTEKLRLPSGLQAEAILCRTRAGAVLAALAPSGEGMTLPLHHGKEVSYQRGFLQDRLQVGDKVFTISAGQRRSVRELLTAAEVSHFECEQGFKEPSAIAARRRFAVSATVAAPSALTHRILNALIPAEDDLLLWAKLRSNVTLASRFGGTESANLFVLISEHHAWRVLIGELGKVVVTDLDAATSWRDDELAQRGNEEGFALAFLIDTSADERVLVVAARNWTLRDKNPHFRARAAMLLRRLLARENPYAHLTAFFLKAPLGLQGHATQSDVDDALAVIDKPGALVRWWKSFQLPPAAGMLVIERARALDLSPALFLPLHEAIWEQTNVDAHLLEAARVDLDLAEHLLAAGEKATAAELIRTRLEVLPGAEIDDFLPHQRPELREVRLRALSLLAAALPSRRSKNLTRLLQRAPLDVAIAARLARGGQAWAQVAAAEIEALLSPGGLEPGPEHEDTSKVRALKPESMQLLTHPAGQGATALGVFQGYLAVTQEPDRSSLRAFCERLGEGEQPVAATALADAVFLLGAPAIDAFVSRGEKGIGVRAYAGQPPFILLGGHHLDPASAFFLRPHELRFAVAAEVAHLRFKHQRMTSSEVWTGAWDKSRAGLDLVFTLLPVLKGWELAEKLVRAVTLTRKAVGTASKAARKKIREESLGVRLRDLVEAHRLMQLTADRAGLLLAGNLKHALRAMFLLDPTLRPELQLALEHGLATVLLRKDEEGALYQPDLLIRASALIGFYLSGTWERLLAESRGSSSPATPATDNKAS